MAGLTPLQRRLAELREMAEESISCFAENSPASVPTQARALLALLPVVEAVTKIPQAYDCTWNAELFEAVDACERALTSTEPTR